MATGDPADMASRMAGVLPARWFPSLDEAPVLNGVLTGIGQAWSFAYALLTYARTQARLSTATGSFLDMISTDFNGATLTRNTGETDNGFRTRIAATLAREKATRTAVTEAVTSLTGGSVTVFEPMRPADTGGYGSAAAPSCGGGGGYGSMSFRYGSLAAPYEIFVDATRPSGDAVSLAVMGYASAGSVGAGPAIGGYGAGAVEYAASSVLDDVVTDITIEAAIVAVLPVSCTAWVRFS